ncbi:MAG: hypothetical protein AAF125_15565 [Chloroflexota bacterium]
MTDNHTEPSILPEDEAKERLRAAIAANLGADWDAPDSGWVIVSNHAYMARLNKGRRNVDFYVDYFTGEVSVEVKEVGEGQDVGRAIAWTLLILFAVVVAVFARNAGLI